MTYNFFAVNPAFCVSYQLLRALLLRFSLLDGSLQNPDEGFGDGSFSSINNTVSASTSLLDNAATVLTSSMTGRVLRNWRWSHNPAIQRKSLHWWHRHNCSCHFEWIMGVFGIKLIYKLEVLVRRTKQNVMEECV